MLFEFEKYRGADPVAAISRYASPVLYRLNCERANRVEDGGVVEIHAEKNHPIFRRLTCRIADARQRRLREREEGLKPLERR